MDSTETEQMYLVTIDRIMRKKGIVRSIDIGEERGFSKSTVHVGLKKLEAKGLINFAPGNITLTEEGKLIARDIEEKHELIYNALVMLGASEDVAERNACTMEHAMSNEVFALLRKHIAFGEQMTLFMKQKNNVSTDKISNG